MRARDAPFQFLRRALGDDAAMVQHGDAVGEVVGLIQVLGGQQNGDAIAYKLADDLPHCLAAPRVKAGRRLIQKDQPWPSHQCHGEVEAPLHSAGVGGGRLARRLDEVEAFQQFGGSRLPLGCPQMK